MKYIVTIEETCDKNFEVEANDASEAIDVAIRKYKNCEFVLDPGEVTFRQISLCGKDSLEWETF